jgi:hypothetical protein
MRQRSSERLEKGRGQGKGWGKKGRLGIVRRKVCITGTRGGRGKI